ncbi:putative serine/threonine-protein kinase iks1 [Ascosphaera acerosa]|nr:putative serine/threonine-protein kinase iks1 [Ascosphaera acerosa]
MSIIPVRSNNRDIVLRHNDSIIVYDHASRQLVLHGTSPEQAIEATTRKCPQCNRPWPDPAAAPGHHRRRQSSAAAQSEFVNPQYFRMLSSSRPASATSSAAHSGVASPAARTVSPNGIDRAIRGVGEILLGSGDKDGNDGGADARDASSGTSASYTGISAAAFTPHYFQRFFVEERVLGRGGKGVVLLVKHVLDGVDLGHFACKRVPVGDDHKWLEKVLTEVQLLQNLSHPNLVSYRHVWLENAKITNFGPKVPCAFILQQYCNAGDLQNFVYGSHSMMATPEALKARMRRRSRGEAELPLNVPRQLSFDEIYGFFRDITQGLSFLHANGYIHRDLKPSNCLLHKLGGETRVLVSDFGEMQYKTDVRKSTGTTGTISYCAPEVLRRIEPGGRYGNFTLKSDIFSLGMILHFLCFDTLPYQNANVAEEEAEDVDRLRDEIMSWSGFNRRSSRLRSDLPDQLYHIMSLLLSADPAARPSADEVLEMISTPWKGNGNWTEMPGLQQAVGNTSDRIVAVDRVIPMATSEEAEPSSELTALALLSPGALVPVVSGDSDTELARSTLGRRQSLRRRQHDKMEQDILERDLRQGIVLRSSVEPPSTFDYPSQPPVAQSRPLLLPPISNSSSSPRREQSPLRLLRRGRRRVMSLLLPAMLLLLKVLSLTQPCLPAAVSPRVMYVTLLLAAMDFAVTDIWLHAVSLLLHCVFIYAARRRDALCVKLD